MFPTNSLLLKLLLKNVSLVLDGKTMQRILDSVSLEKYPESEIAIERLVYPESIQAE